MKKSLPVLFLFILSGLTILNSSSFAQSWKWAKSAGGAMKVESYSIGIDDAGNSYITGWFEDSLKFGTTTLVANSNASDAFIAKYDANGNVVWARKAGGTNWDYGSGITADAAGNCYVTGAFIGTATFGSLTVTSTTVDYDIFIAKYDPNGNALWVKNAGGNAWDYGSGITVDNSGNCYVTGAFRNTGTFGSISFLSAGSYDGFVAKYDNSGTAVWAKKMGGTGNDYGSGVSVDASGNCYVTGYFNGTASVGSTSLVSSGNSDVFIAKYDATGNEVWAKKGGGSFPDVGRGISTDPDGNSFITGYFRGNATFDGTTIASLGEDDIFVGKYNTNGNLQWIKKFGGIQNDQGYAISADTSGSCYLTGSFFGTATFDTITVVSANQDDAFVAGLDYYGKAIWVVDAGGVNVDVGRGIATNDNGDCVISGHFGYNATFDTIAVTGFGDNDLFVAKVDSAFVFNPPGTGINESPSAVQDDLVIFPNPFTTNVTIQVELETAAKIAVELFDVLGREVTSNVTITETQNLPNKRQLLINRGKLPEGLYFGKVIAGDKIHTMRLMVIK